MSHKDATRILQNSRILPCLVGPEKIRVIVEIFA